MKEFQITVGYKAVICFNIKAENESDAKNIGLEQMKKFEDRAYSKRGCELQDSNYKIDGILDMDNTWNMVQS